MVVVWSTIRDPIEGEKKNGVLPPCNHGGNTKGQEKLKEEGVCQQVVATVETQPVVLVFDNEEAKWYAISE